MGTQSIKTPLVQPTEHPYIVRVEGVCGGSPIIKGTRISVRIIAELYKMGVTVDEILQMYPHLNAAAVYDAISYYLDHQEEIEAEIIRNKMEALVEEHLVQVNQLGMATFEDASQTDK